MPFLLRAAGGGWLVWLRGEWLGERVGGTEVRFRGARWTMVGPGHVVWVGGASEGAEGGARARLEAGDDAVDAACFSGCGDGEVGGVGSGVEWSGVERAKCSGRGVMLCLREGKNGTCHGSIGIEW